MVKEYKIKGNISSKLIEQIIKDLGSTWIKLRMKIIENNVSKETTIKIIQTKKYDNIYRKYIALKVYAYMSAVLWILHVVGLI